MESDELEQPPLSAAELLSDSRRRLRRVLPREALEAGLRGDALIDIRSEAQVDRDGAIPNAHHIERNVLEWRLEPEGADSIPELARTDRRVILICDGGYQSSLAAANLRRMGLDATDLEGGFQRWREEGLPIEHGCQDDVDR